MMIKVHVLPADEGDFIVVSYGERLEHHILIDGGLENSGDDYAEIIKDIAKKKQKIDAVILTHIDSDHIQGAIKGISLVSKEILKQTIRNIYFNTCRGFLRRKHKLETEKKYAEDEIEVSLPTDGCSLGEAFTFLQYVRDPKN